jgi:hypothetical protein
VRWPAYGEQPESQQWPTLTGAGSGGGDPSVWAVLSTRYPISGRGHAEIPRHRSPSEKIGIRARNSGGNRDYFCALIMLASRVSFDSGFANL